MVDWGDRGHYNAEDELVFYGDNPNWADVERISTIYK